MRTEYRTEYQRQRGPRRPAAVIGGATSRRRRNDGRRHASNSAAQPATSPVVCSDSRLLDGGDSKPAGGLFVPRVSFDPAAPSAELWAKDQPLSAIGLGLGVSRSKIAGAIDRAHRAGDTRFAPRPTPIHRAWEAGRRDKETQPLFEALERPNGAPAHRRRQTALLTRRQP